MRVVSHVAYVFSLAVQPTSFTLYHAGKELPKLPQVTSKPNATTASSGTASKPGMRDGDLSAEEVRPKTMTSSSATETLATLFDGSKETYWQSSSETKPHWIELRDFGCGRHRAAKACRSA